MRIWRHGNGFPETRCPESSLLRDVTTNQSAPLFQFDAVYLDLVLEPQDACVSIMERHRG